MQPLQINDIQRDPGCAAAQVSLRDGRPLTVRPLTPGDAAVVGRYFLSVSDELKSLYGPHPFDQATADRLCAEAGGEQPDRLRLIGQLADGEVIAYFILQLRVPEHELARYAGYGIALDPETTCRIAPSVLDAYQNQGIGSPIMRHAYELARRMGYRRMVLEEGVFGHNARARHFYSKLGFSEVGIFYPDWSHGRPCHDMMVDL